MPKSAPLPSLLWAVLTRLEQEYVRRGADSPGMPSLDLWANLLRVLDVTGTDPKALSLILCLSRRAVRNRVVTAVRRGWAENFRNAEGRSRVRLTVRGSEVAERWRSLQREAEAEWRRGIGMDRANHLSESLVRIVAALPLEHPHYPASYGAADASMTGGGGQDWKPVRRTDSGTVAGLPLFALLSQAIVAFAIEYEERSPVALSLSTTIIRRIPAAGRSVRELGDSVGVSALVRHRFLSIRGTSDSGIATLTPRGTAVSEAYDRRVQEVEKTWRDCFGNEAVAAMRRSLEAARRLTALYGAVCDIRHIPIWLAPAMMSHIAWLFPGYSQT